MTDRLLRTVSRDGTSWFRNELPGLVGLVSASLERGDTGAAGALLAALRAPMTRAGLVVELAALAARCRSAPGSLPLESACAAVTEAAAWSELGDHDRADRLLQGALPHVQNADPCTEANAWYEVGWVASQRGERARSNGAYHHALRAYHSDDNRFGLLGCHVGLFELHGNTDGDPGEAAFHTEAARSLAAKFDDPRTTTKVALALCELPSATAEDLAHLQAAVERSVEDGDAAVALRGLRVVVAVSTRLGKDDTARLLAKRAASIARDVDNQLG